MMRSSCSSIDAIVKLLCCVTINARYRKPSQNKSNVLKRRYAGLLRLLLSIVASHVAYDHGLQIADIRQTISDLNKHLKALRAGEYTNEADIPDKMPKDAERTRAQLAKAKERLAKWEIKKIEKEENKAYSITTSKTNYLDPRITVAWCARAGFKIEKIFAKSLRQKVCCSSKYHDPTHSLDP
jgi:DNA-binding transcriptional MerR regulator